GTGEIGATPVQAGWASGRGGDLPETLLGGGGQRHHLAGMRLVSKGEAAIPTLRVLEKDGPSPLAAENALQSGKRLQSFIATVQTEQYPNPFGAGSIYRMILRRRNIQGR